MFSTKELAYWFSRLTGPESTILVALWLAVWIINGLDLNTVDVVVVITLLTHVIFPVFAFLGLYSLGYLDDIDVTDRKQRPKLLAIKLLLQAVGVVFVAVYFDRVITFWFCWWLFVTLATFGITLFWKVSLHMVTNTMFVFLLLTKPFLPAMLLLAGMYLLAVGWARYILNKHSFAQILVGFLLPFVIHKLLTIVWW